MSQITKLRLISVSRLIPFLCIAIGMIGMFISGLTITDERDPTNVQVYDVGGWYYNTFYFAPKTLIIAGVVLFVLNVAAYTYVYCHTPRAEIEASNQRVDDFVKRNWPLLLAIGLLASVLLTLWAIHYLGV